MHGDMWLNRLATLSDDSRTRLVDALNTIWPDALGVFEELPRENELVAEGILPHSNVQMQSDWLAEIAPYFHNLNLPFPAEEHDGTYRPTVEAITGGRQGQHTPEFTELWEEMTSVYRLDPEAVW
jgi:ring-1,2-phenylacetyl-CoA epoxidase subunit PaaC